MANLEQIEMARYRRELEGDVQHLVKKYCRIMSWEVPELDEKEAAKLILQALRDALEQASQGS
jgi:20S proteasome alpha/beta subunit